MDHRRIENLFAIASPGLEGVCAAELGNLQVNEQEAVPGGVAFQGRLRDIYLANLWSRSASRILVRLASFRSRDFPDLHRKAQRLPWGSFIRPETPVAFRTTCHTSRLNHTTRIAETLESAVNRALGRTTNPAGKEPQLVFVRIVDDQVTLSIDSSGELLHRRGYRQSTTVAPLRETLAAGALMLLGWDCSIPLADPMCGSGSFLLEGALLATRKAPGLDRTFAFMRWPGYRQGLWELLCNEAQRQVTEASVVIDGGDESSEAISAARENSLRCGVNGLVTLTQCSLSEQPVHNGHGLVICNPPYGKRLSLGDDPFACYKDIGQHLHRAYPDWRKAMICPDTKLVDATGLGMSKVAELDNGGLSVGLFTTGE